MNTGRGSKPSRRRKIAALALIAGVLLPALFIAHPLVAQNDRRSGEQGVVFPPPFSGPPPIGISHRSRKQKEALLKYKFKQLKKHADQLASLSQSLQKKIDQSNEDILSLEVIREAEAIEKLAKRIKDEAKGY